VDDEESDRETFGDILQSEGYTVIAADTYQRAFGIFEANRDRVDLLIADISLPDGSGCELAMAIRNGKPDIRALFISGHVGAQVCRFYGLDVADLHFLRKPFSAKDFTRRVTQVFAAAESFPPRVR
jgi:DNA-binding response OmpR family regulator